MFAKQLTVFIENRSGRLAEVLGVLKENKVNILSLSLADTTEYGLLRLIVDNAALGKEKLTENGFSVSVRGANDSEWKDNWKQFAKIVIMKVYRRGLVCAQMKQAKVFQQVSPFCIVSHSQPPQ